MLVNDRHHISESVGYHDMISKLPGLGHLLDGRLPASSHTILISEIPRQDAAETSFFRLDLK